MFTLASMFPTPPQREPFPNACKSSIGIEWTCAHCQVTWRGAMEQEDWNRASRFEGERRLGRVGMFEQPKKLGLLELSAVREVANIGLGHATTALSNMTGRSFNMNVPYAESVALTELPLRLGNDELYAGICMAVDGEVPGHIAFLFPWASAQELWKMLLGFAPSDSSDLGELEASALIEVGNVISGSFLNAIADMTDFRMLPSPPMLAIDMSVAIIAAIVASASEAHHVALAIDTDIFDEQSKTTGIFLFIPTEKGLAHLFSALGIGEAA
jgi:chemotaxis protein CheC